MTEPDIAELLHQFADVDRYYREAVAAMSSPELKIEPVLNSAEITVSFQTAPVLIDMTSEADRCSTLKSCQSGRISCKSGT